MLARSLRSVVTWLFTLTHLIFFALILCCFHPFLWILYQITGKRAFELPLSLMCGALIWNIRLTGTSIKVQISDQLPHSGPVIFVSNHQTMYDIPLKLWYLARYRIRFISKVELGRWLPSISLPLQKGRHLLINRRSGQEAISKIEAFGKELATRGDSVGLYPEGTRARDGELKPFKIGGFKALFYAMPEASIVPVTIDGMWEILRYKCWPIPFGIRARLIVHDPIERQNRSPEECLADCYEVIAKSLKRA